MIVGLKAAPLVVHERIYGSVSLESFSGTFANVDFDSVAEHLTDCMY